MPTLLNRNASSISNNGPPGKIKHTSKLAQNHGKHKKQRIWYLWINMKIIEKIDGIDEILCIEHLRNHSACFLNFNLLYRRHRFMEVKQVKAAPRLEKWMLSGYLVVNTCQEYMLYICTRITEKTKWMTQPNSYWNKFSAKLPLHL